MSIEQITEWIIAILPSVIAVLSFVAVIFKTLKEFRESKKEIFNYTDLTETRKEIIEAKNQLKQVISENYELKKAIKELLTKIDKIQRK